jgi:RHS repeat-associated protein
MGCLKLTYNQYDTTLKVVYKKIDFEQNTVQRFLSVDPMAHEREWVSPYNFVQNNPIMRVDPTGALDDNYLIHENGNIEVQKTEDKTDNFKFMDNKGKVSDLGTFAKNENGLVNITTSGKSFSIENTRISKRFLDPRAFAGFLGASMNYFNKYGLKIQVNQFSTAEGGHSGDATGTGQYIDYRYSNVNGNVNEPVYTSGANFDEEKSQFMVNQLVLFGYNSTPSNLRGTRYSILTQDGFTKNEALENTKYYPGHYHHAHLQNYDVGHIRTVNKLYFPNVAKPINRPVIKKTNNNYVHEQTYYEIFMSTMRSLNPSDGNGL